MAREVKQVRKSIERRKKMRKIPGQTNMAKVKPAYLQEEEKHGYYPYFPTVEYPSYQKRRNLVTGFAVKGMLSILLFFGTALLYETDSQMLATPKALTTEALTAQFPFAKVNVWYRETFGAPLAMTPEPEEAANAADGLALPVSGNITETFQVNGKGIMITPEETTEVSVIREGVVIFAGKDRETGKTVVVQHQDGTTSTYGYLSSVDVHIYQYVYQNQAIGTFIPSEDSQKVYFSIEKDKEYIDPIQVIEVDDVP